MNQSMILFIGVFIVVVVVSGCTTPEPRDTCNSPYINVGDSCCLDQNHNSICDSDEPYCGDNRCNDNETCFYCSKDCGNCDDVCKDAWLLIQGSRFRPEDNSITLTVANFRDIPLTLKVSYNYSNDRELGYGGHVYGIRYYLGSKSSTQIKLDDIDKQLFQSVQVNTVECEHVWDYLMNFSILGLE